MEIGVTSRTGGAALEAARYPFVLHRRCLYRGGALRCGRPSAPTGRAHPRRPSAPRGGCCSVFLTHLLAPPVCPRRCRDGRLDCPHRARRHVAHDRTTDGEEVRAAEGVYVGCDVCGARVPRGVRGTLFLLGAWRTLSSWRVAHFPYSLLQSVAKITKTERLRCIPKSVHFSVLPLTDWRRRRGFTPAECTPVAAWRIPHII